MGKNNIGFLGRDDVVELAPGLYVIAGRNKSRFPFCNAFLITGTETVLIDTGIGYKKLKALDEQCHIDRVIISHPHPDHISGFDLLRDRILMLPEETPAGVDDLFKLGRRFTGTEENGRMWADFARNILNLEPLREPDGRFGDGEVLDFGGIQLEAIHTAGHLYDHYCFFDRNSRTLITTDIDFSSFGPWYGNPESTIEPFIESIHRLMKYPYERVCSSHKPLIEGDATEDFEKFLAGFERHRQMILKLCDRPTTLHKMTEQSPFYHHRLKHKSIQYLFERNMIRKNLDLLIRDGFVTTGNGIFLKAKS